MPSNLELSNQLRVAEYNALRSEINNRTTAQHTVLSLNLTIAAAVSSIAFGNTGNVHIVFVLPVICPLLGLLYLDHANAIVRLGEKAWTIYNDVGPHVPERLKGEATERYAHGFALVIGAMFLAIPVLALVESGLCQSDNSYYFKNESYWVAVLHVLLPLELHGGQYSRHGKLICEADWVSSHSKGDLSKLARSLTSSSPGRAVDNLLIRPK